MRVSGSNTVPFSHSATEGKASSGTFSWDVVNDLLKSSTESDQEQGMTKLIGQLKRNEPMALDERMAMNLVADSYWRQGQFEEVCGLREPVKDVRSAERQFRGLIFQQFLIDHPGLDRKSIIGWATWPNDSPTRANLTSARFDMRHLLADR